MRVSDVGQVPDETVALVWRVAQEAVRNAIRHAHATSLDVDVHRRDGHLVLVVTDDGDGFDPTADRDPSSFGLRGLASLVQDEGGRLDVGRHPARARRYGWRCGSDDARVDAASRSRSWSSTTTPSSAAGLTQLLAGVEDLEVVGTAATAPRRSRSSARPGPTWS